MFRSLCFGSGYSKDMDSVRRSGNTTQAIGLRSGPSDLEVGGSTLRVLRSSNYVALRFFTSSETLRKLAPWNSELRGIGRVVDE
jgi:hypothetical protein